MAVIDPITHFYNRIGRYPGNNKQWWLARAEVDDDSKGLKAGDFVPEILDKLLAGSMRAPRGHFVLHAFNKDRTFASGIADIPAVTTNDRPPTVTFFSGRVWFGCRSTVYFSQVLTDKHKAGLCFQEADPTSEHISDLIDTDGGEITIPEANKIVRIVPHAGGVVVFALNGVWYITGTSAGFSATDISVNKVSPVGCRAPQSIVETEEALYYWSDVGIMGMSQKMGQFGPVDGKFDKTNLSEETIQSFYNDISDAIRTECKGVFDPKANVVYWLYRDTDVAATQYNRVLVLDLTIGSFTPWKIGQLDAATKPFIKGFYHAERVTTYDIDTDIDPTQIEYITSKGAELRFAQMRSSEFADWYTEDSVGAAYDSYVESGYELFNDAMRRKNITYIFTYLKRTETEADANGIADDPSSCYMRVKWDWANGSHSNKWTPEVQVYRPGRLLFDPDTGFGLAVSKNKVRGNGKAIQFRFGTSERGKNFDLHGWSIAVSGNSTP